MSFTRCIAVCAAVLLLTLSAACQSSTTTAGTQLVDVPGTALMQPVETIRMPAELLDAANGILAESDWQLPIDRVFNTGTLAERRAINYLMYALYQDVSTEELSVWTPVCSAGAYATQVSQLADGCGAVIDLDIEDDDDNDLYILMWGTAKTRQYLADIGDKFLRENTDTVWYVELSQFATLT